ncbi:MAG: hypothetical protein A3K12_03630 [Candidatus Rokubacteria bacterium RIFCSPLOWO2_12_FULL_71_19]|nr:MAG: hypothetical protein A3K12_03630 [Candidatus Rokubacteria bacterium RIFCSPLOWO2_12_FULL_71_19]
MNRERIVGALLALGVMIGGTAGARAAETTPPRVSYINSEVSFWRPGATDWTPAQLNTPLAPGDLLYTGPGGNVEIQIGARAFVRAAEGTQLGLVTHEPDFVQFKVTAGHASLDLRELSAGQTVELDTPGAALTIERTGYYRVDVAPDTTTFITRRGGRATLIPAGGAAAALAPNEQVVIRGTDAPSVETYAAPELSAWDRWNYARTEQLVGAVSGRYVPPGVAGAGDLDRYGSWRVVESYGPVWTPDARPPGWAPYSTGRWIWDPRYQWTWVDDAPWGWAPYHYGRWIFVDGSWGWAPGPLVVRPVYAPALVVFLGSPFAPSLPLSWVALGWGEPVIPWWGRPGFIGRPWWGGWGGPRVVNNVVVNRNTVVNVQHITVFRNVAVANAVVAVPTERFGQGHVAAARVTRVDIQRLAPIHGPLGVKPVARSLAPETGAAARPPETVLRRAVVATRAPQDVSAPLRAEGLAASPHAAQPAPRLVVAPAQPRPTTTAPGPPPGRQISIEPPRSGATPRREPRQEAARGEGRQAPVETPRPSRPSPPTQTVQPAAPPAPGPGARQTPATAPASQAPPALAPGVRQTPPTSPAAQAPSAPAPGVSRAPAGTPAAAAQVPAPRPPTPPARAERVERAPRALLGEPANRVSPRQVETGPRGNDEQSPAMPGGAPGTGSPRGRRQ